MATDSPFSYRIQVAEIPSKFKLPPLPAYDGTSDPMVHLNSFNAAMKVARGDFDELKCQVFPLTLSGKASIWFSGIAPKSIDSFYQLSMEFTSNFYSCRKRRATASDLFQLQQHKNESLRDFCARFNLTINEIHHLHVSVALPAFLKATTNLNLIGSLSKSEPTSLSELVARQ